MGANRALQYLVILSKLLYKRAALIRRLRYKEIYLVGGCIRDILLKKPLNDIDIAMPLKSIGLARVFANKIKGSFFIIDKEGQIARVVKKEGKKTVQFDFAPFKGRDIMEDLSNRDFTINAMAIDISDSRFQLSNFKSQIQKLKIIDPFNGGRDLRNRIIRVVRPEAFESDPLRMLRGVRFASDFKFSIEDDATRYIKRHAAALKCVSSERIRDELFKILRNRMAYYYLSLLDELKLLKAVLPEIEDMRGMMQGSYHKYDLWTHSLKTLEYAEGVISNIKLFLPEYADKIKRHLKIKVEQDIDRLSLLKFAALLHDIGKPSTIKIGDGKVSFYQHWTVGAEINKRICRRLAMSSSSEDIVSKITANHMRPLYLAQLYNPPSPPFANGGQRGIKEVAKGGVITKRALYRFFRDTGDTGIEVILLSIADAMATSGMESFDETITSCWLTKGNKNQPSPPSIKGGTKGGFSEKNYKVVANAARKMVSYFYTEYKRQRRRPLINGADLIKIFRLQPGTVIGRILRDIDEARGAGVLKNKRDAFNYVENNLHKWII